VENPTLLATMLWRSWSVSQANAIEGAPSLINDCSHTETRDPCGFCRPVHVHEGTSGRRCCDRQVQSVALGDRCPVVHAGAAQRIDAELEPEP
jgi:hypothetical protein